jgi:hypothetical protein
MWTAIILLSIVVVAQAVLFFFLHARVERIREAAISTDAALDLLNDNQNVLNNGLQRVTHEVQALKKEK